MSPLVLASTAVFAPLAVALTLMIVRPLRHTGVPAAALAVIGALASLGSSIALLAQQLRGAPTEIYQWDWLQTGGTTIATVGFQIDGISAPMLFVVSLVATCVQVFSLEYMNDEDNAGYGRYFTWHALFLFSMQALVVAPNLLQLFAAWELVGLCSYLLIGFYYTKPSAARASLKAFWMTKLADMGLLLGLIFQYVMVHGKVAAPFGWDASVVYTLNAYPASIMGYPIAAASLVAALYFIAVMGKSAQFPLHIWLPDAMEGPTPVSALLHAATMVAAGVYLIVRAYPIFLAAPDVMVAMSWIGGFTALFAACVAIIQTDIKKVLAYSTVSQLGYMVAALGAGSLMGGYFHLTTHAFFKALLFLSAGSVIHAVHSNEMSDMGGLFRKMKLTGTVFILGSLALSGLPFLSGFYSKDLILESLYHAAAGSHEHAGNAAYYFPFLACTLAAGLTAYYMGRVILLTFFGEPSEKASHAHEHGPAMSAPLVVLATLAVAAGWGGGSFYELFSGPMATSGHAISNFPYEFHLAEFTAVGVVASALAISGLGVAYVMHAQDGLKGLRTALVPVGDFIRAGRVDRTFLFLYKSVMTTASDGLAWFDRYVIDGFMNALGAGMLVAGDRSRRAQTGNVSDYVTVVLASVMILALWSQVHAGGAG